MPETAAPLPTRPRRVDRRVGPYSKYGAIATLDGRSKPALLMKRIRAELVAHVGGKPNAVERQLIERAVRLTWHLEMMDERLANNPPTLHDLNAYIAWQNALGRTLARLGLKGAAAKPPSLADYLAERERAKQAAP